MDICSLKLESAQALGSAYRLRADDKELHDIYEDEVKSLVPWVPSPSEVTEDDWQEFLGNREYVFCSSSLCSSLFPSPSVFSG